MTDTGPVQLTVPVESETLEPEELKKITGKPKKRDQAAWLKDNGWIFTTNAANDIVVGRLYARLKLAGLDLRSLALASGGPKPDFSKVR